MKGASLALWFKRVSDTSGSTSTIENHIWKFVLFQKKHVPHNTDLKTVIGKSIFNILKKRSALSTSIYHKVTVVVIMTVSLKCQVGCKWTDSKQRFPARIDGVCVFASTHTTHTAQVDLFHRLGLSNCQSQNDFMVHAKK